MGKTDYYKVLGVDKSADGSTLKKAYRALAMSCHPDRNPGDSLALGKMKEINEAYAVLSDQEKRRLYDTYGHAGLEGFNQSDIFKGVDFEDVFGELFGGGFSESIFGNLFGGRRTKGYRKPQRGADLRYDLTIGLEAVALGKEEEVEYSISETCLECNGLGSKNGGSKECEECHGSGQSVKEQRNGFNIFRQITACKKCRGKGSVITDPCDKCEGKGTIEKRKKVQIRIPKGADTGYSIRLEGEGGSGKDGNGDLYVVLNIEKHPVFERHGDDLYVVKEIEFPQAALGGELKDVPGLEENVEIEIPEGTQSGTLFRVENMGMPRLNSHSRGDEYIVIKVVTPTNLTEEGKNLLRRFEETRKQYSNTK